MKEKERKEKKNKMSLELLLIIISISALTLMIVVCSICSYCYEDYTHFKDSTMVGDTILVINNISLENAKLYCKKYCYDTFVYTDASQLFIIKGKIVPTLWYKENSGVYIS